MFQPRNLNVLAYANGFTLWHYRTGDDVAELTGHGYFSAAGELLRAGDQIIVSLDLGDRPGLANLLVNEAASVGTAHVTVMG